MSLKNQLLKRLDSKFYNVTDSKKKFCKVCQTSFHLVYDRKYSDLDGVCVNCHFKTFNWNERKKVEEWLFTKKD